MDKELDEGDKQVLSDIEKYGLHVVHILGDDDGPSFSFSIGLFQNYQHPEIIIVGLRQELNHVLINDIAADIKKGKSYNAFSYSPDILENYQCYFVPVDKSNYRNYLGYAHWYYKGDNFPVLQCIYPTTKGIYPWEDKWPESIKNIQPVLGPLNI